MILHIDMDAFFASVEQLDNPELKGRCVIVGGTSKRAVVSTASYEARKFGVHSAMPMFEARRRCPHAVIVSPRMSRYQQVSDTIMAVIGDFAPQVERVSIDEAYADISGCNLLFRSPEDLGYAVKQKISDSVHLTCSVGIAPNKFLAKIASDLKKPDGLTIIAPEYSMAFIQSLPVEKVPGVGRVMTGLLKRMGIMTLGDISRYPETLLTKNFGKFGLRLIELSRSIDHSPVCPQHRAKSVSSEDTLEIDTCDRNVIERYMMRQAHEVAMDLRKSAFRAKTVTIKIKYSDFNQVTRSVTLSTPTCSSEMIYKTSVQLFRKLILPRKVRLVGVGASNLVSETTPIQIELFSEKNDPFVWEKVDKTIDSISLKFGNGSVRRASQIVPSENR